MPGNRNFDLPEDEWEGGAGPSAPEKKEWLADELGDAVAERLDGGAADRVLHDMLDEWALREREKFGPSARGAEARVVLPWRTAAGPPDARALLNRGAAEALLRRAGVPFLRVWGVYLTSSVEAMGPDGKAPGECAVTVVDVQATDGLVRTVHLYWRPGPDGLWRLVRAAAELQV